MNRQELKAIIQAEKAKFENTTCRHRICICSGASCITSGSEEVMKKLQEEIKF